ncbi:MAG: RraA family protein [Candidatus Hydrogenedentes bacterium]|nr:RraA family protein [Candidatus Hydrogenedentota bacterium]
MSGENQVLQKLRTVRTSDLSDALDSMGYQQRYVMSANMRPMYAGIRFAGIARTYEYTIIDRSLPAMSYEEFAERQYKEGPEGLWHDSGPMGGPDEVMVIDAKGQAAGVLGSFNTLWGRIHGMVGYVIDGSCRDSYECVLQKTPVFCTVRSPQHPMGRIGPVSYDRPIVCGGVRVNSGDYVVADDDGVAVLPKELAEEVARRAVLIQDQDRPARRAAYEKLGLPLDDTV